METAFTYIAESVVKAVGVAGIEAMAMAKAITMVWNPLATEFSNELLEAVITSEGEVRPERAELIMARHRLKLTHDFVEEVAPYIEEFAGYAYDRGKEFILSDAISGILEVKKQTEAVIESLVSLTGSTKENVQRTIKRWFKTTQGQYFDRFIVPETERLLSYAEEAEGKITTLRQIGQNYKAFVEADAYWSAVSEFNAESSKIWAEIQTLHEIGVDTYTIVAIIDNKTCPVCIHMNETTWSVQQAVSTIYDMLIMESEEAYARNPFPPRSTPKDYPDPQEAPYELPPFHPRCRCNVRSTHAISMMPQDVIARPFSTEKPPTNKLLTGVFNTYVEKATAQDIRVASGRVLTAKEYKIAKSAYDDIPYELKKWASRNKTHYKMYAIEGDKISCRVIGERIEINAKFFDPKKYGPEVIQHELRHALINREVINARGGAETLWNTLLDSEFKMPTHVNSMFQKNGGRGLIAMRSAVDEYLALIGDYYSQGMSFDELVKLVRSKEFGIEIAAKAGQITSRGATLWSAKEAKKAVELWWYMMDIDNLTLLTNKQMIAKLSHLPMNAAKMHIATTNELRLRDILRAGGIKKVYQEGDRKPFDIWVGANPASYYSGASKTKPRHMIEVKSIIQAKNDKITMHKDSLLRKNKEWRKFGTRKSTAHTVVFDERTGKIYYKEGLGSFRLGSMTEVSESDLQVLFGGKAQVSELAPTARMPTTVTYKEITTKNAYAEFRRNMELVKPEHRLFLDWYSWEEYKSKGIRIFMDKDGYTGFGLTKDNTLVTLWTRADAPKGIGKRSIAEAIRQGCTNLECFDGKLPQIYGEFGFQEVARYPWNAEYAPKGWLVDKFGKPDYLEMRLVSAEARAAAPYRLTTPIAYTSYDDAAKAALAYMEEVNPEFLDIVKRYTGLRGEFWDWNDILRNSPDLGVALSNKKYGEAITLLHEALLDSPTYKGIVWRGMNLHGEEGKLFYSRIIDAVENDKALQFRGFTSSTTSWDAAHKFAVSRDVDYKILMKIESERGVAISTISGSPKESEILFDAFTSFRVKSFVKTTDDWGNEIWELTLVEEPKYYSVEAARSTQVMAARNRYRTEDLKNLTPLDEDEGRGVNASYTATYKGKKVLYKPIEGESWVAGDMGESWWDTEDFFDNIGVPPDQPIRYTVDNLDLTLAERELMAREVYDELGLNEVKMANVHPVYEGSNLVGVAVEWIDDVEEALWYGGRALTEEEELEMFSMDYLIGNTDRHKRNYMRMSTDGAYSKGTPILIDHGYAFAAGIEEFRCEIMEDIYAGWDWDIDTEVYERVKAAVKRFDVESFIARHPNMSDGEISAMKIRHRELMWMLDNRKVGDFVAFTKSGYGYSGLEDAAMSFFEEVDYGSLQEPYGGP